MSNVRNNNSPSSLNSHAVGLDQLCYTWSTVGYGSLKAGFRIRAASRGLQVINDERVRNLDRYLRYELPEGTDRVELQPHLQDAPRSLALLQPGTTERLLLYKHYVGKDGFNRLGNFFIHLIASLPTSFTPAEAIALWQSDAVWFTSEEQLKNSTELDFASSQHLALEYEKLKASNLPMLKAEYLRSLYPEWNEDLFLSFLQLYLVWRQRWETWQQDGSPAAQTPHFYLAAHPNLIASFLHALAACLPPQLLSGLTFSTFENDIKKSPALLIGTCWLDPTYQQKADLPHESYTSELDLALNCYKKGRQSQPALPQFARDFATHVTTYLSQNSLRPFDALFTAATTYADLDVTTFLRLYDQFFSDDLPPSPPNRRWFNDLTLFIHKFSQQHFQDYINQLALADRSWYDTVLKPALTSIAQYQQGNPAIAATLRSYSRRTQDYILNAILTKKPLQFVIMQEILVIISAPQQYPDIWLYQIEQLGEHLQETLEFFRSYADSHVASLETYGEIRPPLTVARISPLLKIFWHDSDKFFSAKKIPLPWKYLAFTNDLTAGQEIQLKQQGMKSLAFDSFIKDLLKSKDSESGWEEIFKAFATLAQFGYPNTVLVFDALLGSDVLVGNERRLINHPALADPLRGEFLLLFASIYLPNTHKEDLIWSLFDVYTREQPERKSALFDTWLPALSSQQEPAPRLLAFLKWLEDPEKCERLLKEVALLEADRQIDFLESYGPTIFQNYAINKKQRFSEKSLLVICFGNYLDSRAWWNIKSSRFLQTLYTSLEPFLPAKIQNGVENLANLQNSLNNSYATREQFIRSLTQLKQHLVTPIKGGPTPLIERLADYCVNYTFTETQLAVMMMMVREFPHSAQEVLVPQLLYSIAERLRDILATTDHSSGKGLRVVELLEVYIRFALSIEEIAPGLPNQEHFRKSFFDILLKSLTPTDFELLDTNIRSAIKYDESSLQKSWNDYKLQRNFRLQAQKQANGGPYLAIPSYVQASPSGQSALMGGSYVDAVQAGTQRQSVRLFTWIASKWRNLFTRVSPPSQSPTKPVDRSRQK